MRFRLSEDRARQIAGSALLCWGAVAYVNGLFHGRPRPGWEGAGLAIVLLSLAAAGCLAVGIRRLDRWRRAAPVLLVATVALSVTLYAISPKGAAFVFGMIAVWCAITRAGLGWGLGAGSLAIVGMGVAELLNERFRPDLGYLAAYTGLMLGALASRQRRATREAEERTAALAERTRVAREIHDILAHSLSAQIVHLEGARLMLTRAGDQEQILDRVERAQRLARSGLEETRRALATLRGEAPPPGEALAELAEEFRVSTGQPCDVSITGTPRDLSPQAGLAVVRTAQEALTNARKHAPGAGVRVGLRYLDDGVELEISDSGGEGAALAPGGGYGLVGMRERAELIGGTLESGPEGDGFRVSLRVPT